MRQHVTVRLVIDHLRVGQRCAITSSFPSVRLAVIFAAELTELHLVPLARETAYRIGGDQVSDLLRCGISARLTAALGHNRHSPSTAHCPLSPAADMKQRQPWVAMWRSFWQPSFSHPLDIFGNVFWPATRSQFGDLGKTQCRIQMPDSSKGFLCICDLPRECMTCCSHS